MASTIEQRVETAIKELRANTGQLVLIFNGFGGNRNPELMRIADVDVIQPRQKSRMVAGHSVKELPSICLRASDSGVYEPREDRLAATDHDWGRRYFAEHEESFFVAGETEILRTLKERYGYSGQLPAILTF